MSLGTTSEILLHNRYAFLLLLTCILLAIIIWKIYRPKRWELPERFESTSYSEDIPEWVKRAAKEDLDWGHGVGLFPELQMDDERREADRRDHAGFTPQRRWKTLMSLETLAASIILFLALIIIIMISR